MAKTTGKGGSSKSSSPQGGDVPTYAGIEPRMASGGESFLGSHVMPIATTRREMTYVLLESQFNDISELNTTSLLCFNLASLCFAVFLAFVANWLFVENLSGPRQLIAGVMIAVFAVAAMILLIFGVHFFRRKKGKIGAIKDATKARDASLEPNSAN